MVDGDLVPIKLGSLPIVLPLLCDYKGRDDDWADSLDLKLETDVRHLALADVVGCGDGLVVVIENRVLGGNCCAKPHLKD